MAGENPVFKFEDIEFRPAAFELLKAEKPTPIEPKALRALEILILNRDRVVTKDELLDALWPDANVTENSLTRCIAGLRRQLGDNAREPRFIATVHTEGYRFVCALVESDNALNSAESRLQVAAGDREPGLSSRRTVKLILGALVACAVILAGAWMTVRWAKRSSKAASQPPAGVVQLTNLGGEISWPALSPDGNQIAFVWDPLDHPGRGDLYVQFVGSQSPPLRLTRTRGSFLTAPTWLPNGREVSFGQCDDEGGAIYVISALGGPAHRITEVSCPFGFLPPVSWTPDGRTMVLADSCEPGGPRSLVVFSIETGARRCLVEAPEGEEISDSGGVLSPDGKTVAFVRWISWGPGELYTVPLEGGIPTQLTNDRVEFNDFMWTVDGKFLCFRSARGGTEKMWRVPAGGGPIELEPVYPEIGALSQDGRRLIYAGPSSFHGSSVWRATLAAEGGAVLKKQQLLPDSTEYYAPQPSPDGREIVFESERSGHDEIWKANADGTDPRKLTSLAGLTGTPRWSPDGKSISFDYLPHGEANRQIFVMDAEGRNLHVVVADKYNKGATSWSRDGRAIYFFSHRTGVDQIWRFDLATGKETQLTVDGGFAAFESFDGKTLYFSKFRGGIWSMPVGGGKAERVTDALHLGYWGEFAVTENGIYLVDSDTDPGPALMYYSFRTRELKRILNLNGPPQKAIPGSANLGASRDGRTVFFIFASFRNSLVMAENLRAGDSMK